MPSLSALAQLVGMPGKMDVDGSKVESMFAHGRYAEIRDYCLHDVVQTTFVFLRTELLRGRLTQDEYRVRAQSLWTDPRTRPPSPPRPRTGQQAPGPPPLGGGQAAAVGSGFF